MKTLDERIDKFRKAQSIISCELQSIEDALDDIEDCIERQSDEEIEAQGKELREEVRAEVKSEALRELLDELRPVLELAWRTDPSLVEYHLRRLDIDPTVELAAVKHEASTGRAA